MQVAVRSYPSRAPPPSLACIPRARAAFDLPNALGRPITGHVRVVLLVVELSGLETQRLPGHVSCRHGQRIVLIGAGVAAISFNSRMFLTTSRLSRAAMDAIISLSSPGAS